MSKPQYVIIDRKTGHVYSELYYWTGTSRTARIMTKQNNSAITLTFSKKEFRFEKVKAVKQPNTY